MAMSTPWLESEAVSGAGGWQRLLECSALSM